MNYTNLLKEVFLLEDPSLYFRTLRKTGELKKKFPELQSLVGVIQPLEFHPEGDVFEHTMQVLTAMRKLSDNPSWLYTALVHDFGKSVTPKESLPKHHNHEKAGIPLVKEFNKRLNVPEEWAECALYGTEHHGRFHLLNMMRPVKMGDFIDYMMKSPLGLDGMMALGLSDTRGKNAPESSHENVDLITGMMKTINFPVGEDLPIREKRAKLIKAYLKGNTIG